MVSLYPLKPVFLPILCASKPPAMSPIPAHPQNQSDPGRTAVKHVFAEQTEQNLRGPSTGRPDACDETNAQYERRRTHVADTRDVFVPRPEYFVLGEIFASGTKALGNVQLPYTE